MHKISTIAVTGLGLAGALVVSTPAQAAPSTGQITGTSATRTGPGIIKLDGQYWSLPDCRANAEAAEWNKEISNAQCIAQSDTTSKWWIIVGDPYREPQAPAKTTSTEPTNTDKPAKKGGKDPFGVCKYADDWFPLDC
ncbi:hypothetical protein ACTOB_006151 [Actinoplanes oblitus]|uniref:Uncharacterized protein n=1 Tax=Actinoplanes oblitus TaxID=3040509 RepID=A0ABY8W8L1_9ACTN|nr:hypothetical protein [Actinoplanes oblitus]WIM94150.1 hypothetical protein ACTOB_006151 [Actinoplanes oblitus]